VTRLRLVLCAFLLALSGCIVVPDDLRADFEPPDGKRPNNFGTFQETPTGPVVVPDRPTIPPSREGA
jgi:hypothetical protein